MRYCSIDIETTGLDYSYCQMIEFGVVLDELPAKKSIEELPTFHCYILRDKYIGEPYALSMHAEIFRRIAERTPGYNYYDRETGYYYLKEFLFEHKYIGPTNSITVAGKNFHSFDFRFLENDGWAVDRIFGRRSLDPAQLYLDLNNDDKLPNLQECLNRIGIKKTVSHTAIEDALDVVRLMRDYYAPKYKE